MIKLIKKNVDDFVILFEFMKIINWNYKSSSFYEDSLDGRSRLILAIGERFKNYLSINELLEVFSEHINAVHEKCLNIGSICTFDANIHRKVPWSSFNVAPVINKLVDIADAPLCLWSSVSYNLFGDKSMRNSLCLLTVSTVLKYEKYFRELHNEMVRKNERCVRKISSHFQLATF